MLENLLTHHIKSSGVTLQAGDHNGSFKMMKRYYCEVYSTSKAAGNEMLIPKMK